jgi:hypothetical protein
MKYLVGLVLLFIAFRSERSSPLVEIRNLYEDSAKNKAANTRLIKLLEDLEDGAPLFMGYRGAAVMMEANYVLSPLSKLNRFKTGKALIERALKASPGNLELRYIRLTIQTNLPRFLGYAGDIAKDKGFLIGNLSETQDVDLRKRIVAYLSVAKICSEEELRKINLWKNK